MSTQQQVTVRDLVEEAKKRIVFLAICIVGLAYLMSLTSSSVWVNLPAAATLIIVLRYLALDFVIRKKAAAYNSKTSLSDPPPPQKKPLESSRVLEISDWKRKVNSPVVECAIDQFTRHLISEMVTDLWYSRITPDKQAPGELVHILNGALGEISSRMRNINLIDLLTRDIVNLICTHLELYRASQVKIDKQRFESLTNSRRDVELKLVLASQNKLHPALFSAEAEHKVLQHLMDGLVSLTFRPEDLHCSFFRYTVRELLACAVMRPVLNLASPRFINERIEGVVISVTNANKAASAAQEAFKHKPNGSTKVSADHFSRFLDPSITGVELVQLKNNNQSRNDSDKPIKTDGGDRSHISKDPLLSIGTRSSRSWSSWHEQQQTNGNEWGDMLDFISRRKTQALAPEHFENMWAKGRNYRKTDGVKNQLNKSVPQSSLAGKFDKLNHSKEDVKHEENDGKTCCSALEKSVVPTNPNLPKYPSFSLDEEDDEHNIEEVDSGSTSSFPTDDDEPSSITGLDSPGIKVWDRKNSRNSAISRIHHPLENAMSKKSNKGNVQYRRLHKAPHPSRKRSRLSSGEKVPVWQEVERTSFLGGDGQDILKSSKGHGKVDESSDDSEIERWGRVNSGANASSSSPSPLSLPDDHSLDRNLLLANSFMKLRCEVLGANIVKSGSKTFAIYSISVTDVNNNTWSIKRRFRHFEELHRRLKEFPEYNLHLPPKHFLSTGLDEHLIQERCKLLDTYLKKLLQLPTVSGSIEVWDFLSVDSQTYMFSNSISIIETLSVHLEDKPRKKSEMVPNSPLTSRREHLGAESKESMQMKQNFVSDWSRSPTTGISRSPMHKNVKECSKPSEDSGSDKDSRVQISSSSIKFLEKGTEGSEGGGDGLPEASELLLDAASDPTLPTEFVPPNLSVPILDLVDVLFQLQDGGWIRRKAFWVAKQVLQLGMGDAFDDWLIEKIQHLRKGSVIASAINRVEQILWQDGIFITKRQRQPSIASTPTQMSFEEQERMEADRRAKFVYELMIDNAPATIVSLVGRKEYEQCAKDLYFFLQSSVCLKQLAYDLLELVLLSAFPEMDHTFKQLHEEKDKFGEFKEG